MKLDQLEQVVEIANTRSISKAATNLFLSQPSLSTSIKQLEGELGADIFSRTRKGVELTPFGMNFVKYAEKILEQVHTLGKLSKENIPQISQTLSVANGHFRFASVVIAMMLNRHREDGARFILRNGINEDCIDWTADGVCDIGIVSFKLDEENEFKRLMKLKQLNYQVIYQPPSRVIIGEGHPLFHTSVTEVDYKAMMRYPLIAYDDAAIKSYLRSTYLHAASHNLRVIVTDRASMYEMLEFTDGYSLGLSNDTVYGNVPRYPKTRTLKLKNSQARHCIAWIASANVEFMPLGKEYIELLADVCTKQDFWQLHPDITIEPGKRP